MYNDTPIYNANAYPCPFYAYTQVYQCPYIGSAPIFASDSFNEIPRAPIVLRDYGPEPFAADIEDATKQNNAYRTALWTGKHLQLTLMSINVGDDIGLEMHPDVDQFIRLEQGRGIVRMGDRKDNLDFQANVSDDFAFIIPAGKWHNLINTGSIPIKLYSIYAPPQHPHGTVHQTKADAQAAERRTK